MIKCDEKEGETGGLHHSAMSCQTLLLRRTNGGRGFLAAGCEVWADETLANLRPAVSIYFHLLVQLAWEVRIASGFLIGDQTSL